MLYSCPDYRLFVYETKVAASVGRSIQHSSWPREVVLDSVAHWAQKLNCKVWWTEVEQPFLFIEEVVENNYILWKISANDFVGWIYVNSSIQKRLDARFELIEPNK